MEPLRTGIPDPARDCARDAQEDQRSLDRLAVGRRHSRALAQFVFESFRGRARRGKRAAPPQTSATSVQAMNPDPLLLLCLYLLIGVAVGKAMFYFDQYREDRQRERRR